MMRFLAPVIAVYLLYKTLIWLVLNIAYAVRYIGGGYPSFAVLAPYISPVADRATYISRVDVSAANTIIFFLTAVFVFKGTLIYARSKARNVSAVEVWTPTFPFPEGFKALLIQLGLLGTLFAFIIAFNRLAGPSAETQQSYNPSMLIVPLGAALWSSFTGIGFAYVVLPLIQKPFAALMHIKPELDDAQGVAQLSQALAGFSRNADAVTDALKNMEERTNALSAVLQEVNGNDLPGTIRNLAAASVALTDAAPLIRESHSTLSRAVTNLTEPVQSLASRLDAISTSLASLERSAAQQTTALDKECRALETLSHGVTGNVETSRQLSNQIANCNERISGLVRESANFQARLDHLADTIRDLTKAAGMRRLRLDGGHGWRSVALHLARQIRRLVRVGHSDEEER